MQIYAIRSLRSRPPSTTNKKYLPSRDVTIISCSLGGAKYYAKSVASWLESNPKQVIIVTVETMLDSMRQTLEHINDSRIMLYSVKRADFRSQLVMGLRHTQTDLVVFSDDRVIWGSKTLL